jgi:hypothetical protein
MRRSRKPFRGFLLRREFESLPLRSMGRIGSAPRRMRALATGRQSLGLLKPAGNRLCRATTAAQLSRTPGDGAEIRACWAKTSPRSARQEAGSARAVSKTLVCSPSPTDARRPVASVPSPAMGPRRAFSTRLVGRNRPARNPGATDPGARPSGFSCAVSTARVAPSRTSVPDGVAEETFARPRLRVGCDVRRRGRVTLGRVGVD